MSGILFTYEATSAAELVRKCQGLALVGMSGDWSFRGQADSTWGITPSLLRSHSDGFSPKQYEEWLLKDLRLVLRERTTLPAHIIDDESFRLALLSTIECRPG